jgi:proteasome lid subunit RPN8/RPN11
MDSLLIKLSPESGVEPRAANIPTNRSRRWYSPWEGDGRDANLSVFVSQRTFIRICAHCGSDLGNEVGGWLLGKWRKDRRSGRHFIVVDASLPAEHTRHGSAFLTFTQDTQITLRTNMEQRFPDKELVGWYHTHPKMGVFMSAYDTWLHSNFFPFAYQVALVIEPYSMNGGFFIRQGDGTLDPRSYFGFHELHNHKNRSVVHWRNLLPEMFSEIEREL